MPFRRRSREDDSGVSSIMADEHAEAPGENVNHELDTGLPDGSAAGTDPGDIAGPSVPPGPSSPALEAGTGLDGLAALPAQPEGFSRPAAEQPDDPSGTASTRSEGDSPGSPGGLALVPPGGAPGKESGTQQSAGRVRETFEVQPAAAPGAAPDAADAVFPAAVVLVGNPRLGSDPGRLPGVIRPAPDSVVDGAAYPGFVARGASMRGDDHRLSGDPRQDSIGLWALDSAPGLDSTRPALLACVADGVGSQPLSHLGSAEACALLRDRVAASLPELLGPRDPAPRVRQIMGEVAQGLRDYAARHDVDPKALSTTLTAALIVPRYQQHGAAADLFLFGVGDSPGFRLQEGIWTQIPPEATRDQGVISTSTDALPSRPDATVVHVRTMYVDDVLMICSDGLSRPLSLNESIGARLAAWWGGAPPSLPEFYWQMSFRAQTYGDDRSAVCIWINGG